MIFDSRNELVSFDLYHQVSVNRQNYFQTDKGKLTVEHTKALQATLL